MCSLPGPCASKRPDTPPPLTCALSLDPISFGVILVDVESSNTMTVQLSAAWALFAHAKDTLPKHPLHRGHRVMGWVANDAFNELLRRHLGADALRHHHWNRVLYYCLKQVGPSWPVAAMLIIDLVDACNDATDEMAKRLTSAALDKLVDARASLLPTERVRVDLLHAQRLFASGKPLRAFAVYVALVDDPDMAKVLPCGLREYVNSADAHVASGRMPLKVQPFPYLSLEPYVTTDGSVADADFCVAAPSSNRLGNRLHYFMLAHAKNFGFLHKKHMSTCAVAGIVIAVAVLAIITIGLYSYYFKGGGAPSSASPTSSLETLLVRATETTKQKLQYYGLLQFPDKAHSMALICSACIPTLDGKNDSYTKKLKRPYDLETHTEWQISMRQHACAHNIYSLCVDDSKRLNVALNSTPKWAYAIGGQYKHGHKTMKGIALLRMHVQHLQWKVVRMLVDGSQPGCMEVRRPFCVFDGQSAMIFHRNKWRIYARANLAQSGGRAVQDMLFKHF